MQRQRIAALQQQPDGTGGVLGRSGDRHQQVVRGGGGRIEPADLKLRVKFGGEIDTPRWEMGGRKVQSADSGGNLLRVRFPAVFDGLCQQRHKTVAFKELPHSFRGKTIDRRGRRRDGAAVKLPQEVRYEPPGGKAGVRLDSGVFDQLRPKLVVFGRKAARLASQQDGTQHACQFITGTRRRFPQGRIKIEPFRKQLKAGRFLLPELRRPDAGLPRGGIRRQQPEVGVKLPAGVGVLVVQVN